MLIHISQVLGSITESHFLYKLRKLLADSQIFRTESFVEDEQITKCKLEIPARVLTFSLGPSVVLGKRDSKETAKESDT